MLAARLAFVQWKKITALEAFFPALEKDDYITFHKTDNTSMKIITSASEGICKTN